MKEYQTLVAAKGRSREVTALLKMRVVFVSKMFASLLETAQTLKQLMSMEFIALGDQVFTA